MWEEDFDPYHDIKFALKYGFFSKKRRQSTCRECNRVFKFLTEMKDEILGRLQQVENILSAAATKFKIFMALKVRAAVQEKRIKDLFYWFKARNSSERVIMMVNFKMKVETERHRETKLQYYGKAGMSWHGAGILYNHDRSSEESFKERIRKYGQSWKRQRNDTEKQWEEKEAERYKVEESLSEFFIDIIIGNNKKQDRVLTACIIYSLCYGIRS